MAAHLRDVHHVGHEGEALQFELGDVGLQEDVDLGTRHSEALLITNHCEISRGHCVSLLEYQKYIISAPIQLINSRRYRPLFTQISGCAKIMTVSSD